MPVATANKPSQKRHQPIEDSLEKAQSYLTSAKQQVESKVEEVLRVIVEDTTTTNQQSAVEKMNLTEEVSELFNLLDTAQTDVVDTIKLLMDVKKEVTESVLNEHRETLKNIISS